MSPAKKSGAKPPQDADAEVDSANNAPHEDPPEPEHEDHDLSSAEDNG